MIKRNPSESAEQQVIFEWTKLHYKKYPCLEWCCFSVPNGGSRHKLEAYNLKKQGLKSGVSDILLLVARGGYHGLCLELKVGKNKATENQRIFLEEMKKQGYYTSVCYGALEGIETIQKYLSLVEG